MQFRDLLLIVTHPAILAAVLVGIAGYAALTLALGAVLPTMTKVWVRAE